MKCAIIGAGQLGSRHLQGLSKHPKVTEVFIIDPSDESLAVAEERFLQTTLGKAKLIKWNDSTLLPEELDLLIVATNSKHRLSVLKDVLPQHEVRFLILEKVLFSALSEYAEAEELIAKHAPKTWVNCPRRSYPSYIELKSRFNSVKHVNVQLDMPQFALASNALHFIDLFAFLTDDNDVSVDPSGLNLEPIEAKRAGYHEIIGKIVVSNSKGELTINNGFDGQLAQTIFISTDQERILIQESQHQTLMRANQGTSWKYETTSFNMPFQSDLTTDLVEQLSSDGDCNLPTYSQASAQHIAFIEALNDHFNQNLIIT
jgi:hypothetical protein